MASVPPQPSASHRSSSYPRQESSSNVHEGTSHSAQEELHQSQAKAPKSSPNHFLNDTSSSPKDTEEEQSQIQSQEQVPPGADEPRKCWICFADETEDNPTTSAWRSPCPCALTAHESCLLDWVADLEAPSPRNRTGVPKKIECPQCKSSIVIARPRSPIVEGVNAVEHVTSKLVVPGIVITLAGSVLTGCWIHGLSSVYLVFGNEDANHLFGVDTGDGISAKWGFGLPLIPVVIILSRTPIADNLLPILPILFFASQIPDSKSLKGDFWPPSAAMTVATLPYLRGAYNEIYKRLFAERERRWVKEIQPRAGESGDNDGANDQQDRADGEGEGDVAFELNLEVEIFEEHEEIVNNQQQQGHQAQAGPEAGQAGAQDQPAGQQAPAQRQNNLILSTSRIADTIIGALMFPTISAAMGAILKLTLPRTWTTAQVYRQRPGILQTRWGRSIVGGCLFVVLKDTLLLYSRYRLAQDHKKRRVVDYDRRRGKGSV